MADAYLDCNAEYRNTIAYKDLSSSEKDAIGEVTGAVLEERNAIGDDFNAEVAAFQEANPE